MNRKSKIYMNNKLIKYQHKIYKKYKNYNNSYKYQKTIKINYMILYVELSNKYRYNKQKLVRYRDRRRELWKIL